MNGEELKNYESSSDEYAGSYIIYPTPKEPLDKRIEEKCCCCKIKVSKNCSECMRITGGCCGATWAVGTGCGCLLLCATGFWGAVVAGTYYFPKILTSK